MRWCAEQQAAQGVDLVAERVDQADCLEPAGHDGHRVEGVGAEEQRHGDGLGQSRPTSYIDLSDALAGIQSLTCPDLPPMGFHAAS